MGGRPSSQLLTSRPFTSWRDVQGGGDGGSTNNLGISADKDLVCPFSVEPYSGEVEAGAEQTFTVRFAPQEVRDDNV